MCQAMFCNLQAAQRPFSGGGNNSRAVKLQRAILLAVVLMCSVLTAASSRAQEAATSDRGLLNPEISEVIVAATRRQ